MKSVLLAILLFLGFAAEARLSDGKVDFQVTSNKLIGKIVAGFHFNKEAPAVLLDGEKNRQVLKKAEDEMIFDLTGAEGRALRVSVYVCDDKKTVCEEHQYDFTPKAGKFVNLATSSTAATNEKNKTVKATKPSRKVKYNDHGFIENDLAGAEALAEKEKKLILVDFGAPWCPACVRLETEVFDTKVFKKTTQKLIKLAMSSDSLANREFAEKYKIKALPTMLVLNSKGEELYRTLDFKPADVLSKELAQALKSTVPFAELEKRAVAGNREAQQRLAEVFFNKLDMESAVKWYEKLEDKKNDPFHAYAETNMWAEKNETDAANKDAYIAILKKWLAASPQSYTAVLALNDWASLYGNEKGGASDELKQELKKSIEFMAWLESSEEKINKWFAAWPVSDFAPFQRVELLSQKLTSAQALKDEEQAKVIIGNMQNLLRAHSFDVKRPGEFMVAQSYFRQAGMSFEEEAWLMKLTQAYPDSYVYHQRLARYYSNKKDYAKALPEVLKAVELGEDVRLRNLQLLAQVQKELKQNEEAKKSVERALSLPEAKLPRYQSVAKELEVLKKSL